MTEDKLTEKEAIEGFIECCHILEGIQSLEEKLKKMQVESDELKAKYNIK